MIAEVAVTLWEVHGVPAAAQPLLAPGTSSTSTRAPPRERGGGVPGTFGDLLDGARRIQAAIDPAHPEHAPVPCHNDLLPANLIHDGERVRIVDWEYAGMGNRYFDLGNLSVNNGFNEADDEWLLECYWGEPCTRAAARDAAADADHVGLARGDVGRRAAARSRSSTSTSPSYAEEHFERVRRRVRGPALRRLARGRRRGA